MKSYYKIFSVLALLAAFSACSRNSEDDFVLGNTFFIEGEQYSMEVSSKGISYDKDNKKANRLTVRSDAKWEVVPVEEYSWCRPFPDKGVGPGYFYFIVSQSDEPDARSARFRFLVNGEPFPEEFLIKQEGVGPHISAQLGSYKIKGVGADLDIPLISNVDYSVHIEPEDTDWIKVLKTSRDTLCVSVQPSQLAVERSATLILLARDYPTVGCAVVITQSGGAAGAVSTLSRWTFPTPDSSLAEVMYSTTGMWMLSEDMSSMYQWIVAVASSGAKSTYVYDKNFNYVRFLCQGMVKGDYALMTIPVSDLEPGTIEYSFHGSGSKSGPKFWLAEWSLDGNEWHAISPQTTFEEYSASASGFTAHEVTWSYMYHYDSIGSVANAQHDFTLSFPFPGITGSGTLYIRHTIADGMYIDRTKDSVPGYNGTTRVVIDISVNHLTAKE